MAGKANKHTSQKKTKSKLVVRLMIPMLLLALLQFVVFFAVLIMGGEFSYIERYTYDNLIEKTENRKNYIEHELYQKIPYVAESADRINELVLETLVQHHAAISDIQTDKNLNLQIMEASVDILVELLRRATVNDVYLILETGTLYQDDGSNARAALYLRDLDTMTDAEYDDLLMETGFSSISQEYGIVLDSGWSLHFNPEPDNDSYDFYYQTLETAQQYPTLTSRQLGYWSGFSKPSHSATASMKYSVPLIAADGTVYGILGIGLTENSILSSLPSNDFNRETACYVLGRSQIHNTFDIITHSGSSFSRFVGSESTLQISGMLDENVYDFYLASNSDVAGSIQYMNLYSSESPYANQKWALISIADRNSIIQPLTDLIRMLVISVLITLAVSFVVVVLSCREVVKPITTVIQTMNSKQDYNQTVRFEPSNIYEIDKMTDAITQLQINAQDFSSTVSKMMRIADVGFGTYQYDRSDDSVFVGQSCLKLLKFRMEQDEDVVMSRQEFLDHIISEETRQVINESLDVLPENTQDDYVRRFSITQEDGTVLWMRLHLVHTQSKSIGILQDITNVMMEKMRIEYERDYDSTTGLLNRSAYYRRVEELFRNPDELKITAFVMIDLDNLKYVNDTYGHDFGDDYIKTGATNLKKFEAYGGIVSRLSGDEFNICLSGFSSKDEIRKIIREVREELLQSYCLLSDGKHFKLRASMGISWYPDDADNWEMLMKYADFAMYTIKHSTKGGLAEFDKKAYEMDSVLITGVEEMNRIIDEVAVQYAFQSIISAKTGEIYGYEALMRPQSTIFQSPMELLRVAKTGAKLYEIEHMTWRKALYDFHAQIDAGNIAKECYIFINSISNCILEAADAEALEEAHSNLLSQIVMEVVENDNVSNQFLEQKLANIKNWNAQTALADFGAGYSSEYTFVTKRPNIIKIARSIVSGCDKDISRRTIIKNIVKMAQSNHILVVAEGVETEGELETVISCDVDLLQGYYIDRPVFEPQPISSEVIETIQRLAGDYNDLTDGYDFSI